MTVTNALPFPVDKEAIEDELHADAYPVLAVFGDPPRELPDGVEEWWSGGDVLGHEFEIDGVEGVRYEPFAWRVLDDGGVELTYNREGEFDVTIPSDAYDRVHVVNPMSDDLDDSVLMERSNLRLTVNYDA